MPILPTPDRTRMSRPLPFPRPAADAATPRLPLSQQALQTLREAILAGCLAPGERLVEERLSAELGMSRVPIREASFGQVR